MLQAVRVTMFMCVLYFCMGFFLASGHAKDLRVSLPCPLVPVVESKDKGILVELLKAMSEEYKDGRITWEVFPFRRSVENVIKGKADLHIPQLANPKLNRDDLPFQLGSDAMFKVVFVLYTNKNNKEINPKNIANYRIETDLGIMDMFDFKIAGSPDIESSLKKVDLGRIDGFIMAMPETDMALKKLGLKNIKRWEFAKYDAKIVLPKGQEGRETGKIFSDLIKKLKAKGKYQKIMAPILDQKFDPWQP